MFRNAAILLLAGASCAPLCARQISGTVLAEIDSTALSGAVCSLMATADVAVKGDVSKTADAAKTAAKGSAVPASATTDCRGAFALDCDCREASTLLVSLAGYAPTEVFIPQGSKNLELGAVFLSRVEALDEVTVSAQQVTMGREGRTVVIPSSADLRASATTLSLFDKLPLPGLNTDRVSLSISVDGGTPVILIDGVPSSSKDLNALQPKDIARVEYSRITPARYADKGKSGFINVILKQRNDGGSVYAWLRGCPTTCFFDANLNATYNQGPSQFQLSYVPSWRNYQQVYDNSSEQYIGSDFTETQETHDRNPFNYFYNQLQAKYNYRPNAATLFSATFGLYTNSSYRRSYGTSIDSYLGDFSLKNLTSDKELSPSLDLFLRRDFNPGNSLEVQVVGTIYSDDYYRSNNYTYPDGSTDSYLNSVENRRRSLISEVSYIHYFNSATSLSLGLQNTLSHTTNEYVTTDYKPLLTENNNYAYAKIGRQFGSLYLSLSSGVKLFWMKNDLNNRNYVRNRSMAQLSWSISGPWGLQAGFMYNPSIPSLSALTDYAQQTTQTLVSNGNPDLKTSDNFVYQIMPTYNHRKLSLSLLLTYRDIKNPFISQTSYMGEHKFLIQSRNFDYQHQFSGSLFVKVSELLPGFGVRANIVLNRFWAAGTGWKATLTSVDANVSMWWSKGPFTISYWRKFPGKYLDGFGVSREENGDGLDLQYTPNKHWTLTAGWWYMFEKKGTKYPTWSYEPTNPGYNERYIKNNGNMIVLSVSYSTDFGKLFNAGRRSLNNSDSSTSLFKN